ncbi:MAG: EutN/CcmL family microcompartment protein [Acidobacteriia bacterium]|nr:EutN/CcmL family microcompartment protein [Terriglobia bacterium]
MMLGRVVGRVWATVKSAGLEGQRLLVIQPLTPELTSSGKLLICTDAVGAGAGELIYWCRGKESSFPFLPSAVPTDNTVVAIIDELHVDRTVRPLSESPLC